MTPEEFKKLLEALPNGAELLEHHAAAVSTEKNRGIEESRKGNKESQSLRRFKTAVEKLGYDGEADLDAFVETLTATVEGKQTQGSTELSELQKKISKLQKEFESSQKELNTEKEQRASLQQQNKIKTIEAKLGPKLSDDFYGSQFIIKALLADGSVDLDDSGEVIFKQGDKVLKIDEGIKWLGDTHSDARKNKQTAGAGSQASNQANRPKYSLEQLKAMSPTEVSADLANVNASLKAHSSVAK